MQIVSNCMKCQNLFSEKKKIRKILKSYMLSAESFTQSNFLCDEITVK